MSKNRETELVQLWIWNEEQSFNHWLDQTTRAKRNAPNDRRVKDGISNAERVAVYLLADALEDHHEDYAYKAEPEACFLQDLIGLSLGRVDWYYIAEQLLDYEGDRVQIYETDDVWDLFDTSCDGPWQVQVRETFSSRKVIRTCGHNHHSWLGAKQCRKQKAARAEEGDTRWLNAAIYPMYRTTKATHKANGEPSSQLFVVNSENEPRVLHDPDKDREEELIMAALEELRKGTE